MESILTPIIGYFILIGVGVIMTFLVMILVKSETKWLGTKKTFEWFSTAGRNVKTGLVAASVVSAWTWAATLLQSSTVTYEFGVGGLFWYAAGASIQIVLFAIVAIELKRKAPSSHTFPEIIYARFGKRTHKIFLFFAFATNTIIMSMLILGGAAVVNALTGVNITLAAFLIPLVVIIYTIFGGLKATFFADYLNTVFIFLIVLIFVVGIYFMSPEIGGINGMYNKLTNAALTKPVDGNAFGSYLTLASIGALSFGIINIIGNFGTVFVDQAYWQRAIAARPKAAIKGFLIGGLAWFAIPFTLATTLGLSAIAIDITLTPEEISRGLVAPTTASVLLGDIGAILILTVLFTAVTTAGSAQLIAVSSLVTYDVYRTHVKPASSGRELMKISRIAIIGFGLIIGIIASILFEIGLSLQYVYLSMGIIIGPAVIPISLSLIWKKTNKIAITVGVLMGLIAGISIWLISAQIIYNEISIKSTSNYIPLLFGNITSISIGGIISIMGSLVRPDNFNFNTMKQKIFIADEKIRKILEQDYNEKFLNKASRFTYKYAIILTLALVIIWPLPLYLSGYVFSFEIYSIWMLIAILWSFGAAGVIIILPIIESRVGILEIIKRISEYQYKNNKYKRIKYIHEKDEFKEVKENYNNIKRILIPVDGSFQSIKALRSSEYIFENYQIRIFIVHIIEWSEISEEQGDIEMMNKIISDGKQTLKSITIKKEIPVERIVKLGDPGNKIIELSEKLNADVIIMGNKGLGHSSDDLGKVAKKVLKLSSKPVIFV